MFNCDIGCELGEVFVTAPTHQHENEANYLILIIPVVCFGFFFVQNRKLGQHKNQTKSYVTLVVLEHVT